MSLIRAAIDSIDSTDSVDSIYSIDSIESFSDWDPQFHLPIWFLLEERWLEELAQSGELELLLQSRRIHEIGLTPNITISHWEQDEYTGEYRPNSIMHHDLGHNYIGTFSLSLFYITQN